MKIELDNETNELIDRIASFPWFESVGKCNLEGVSPVKNWSQVKKQLIAYKWYNFRIVIGNVHSELIKDYLDSVSPTYESRCQNFETIWSKLEMIVDELDSNVLDRKISYLSEVDESLKTEVLRSAKVDILRCLLEHHFREVAEPIFYIPRVLPIYEAGHFPCGWDGKMISSDWDGVDDLPSIPEGRLRVY